MIALAATGGGFGGLVAYITHDAPTNDLRQPESSERVSWTHTENLPTDDPALAARIMAGVVQDAPILKQRAGVSARGRKLKDPCLHLTLSWAPKENPTPKEMISATREALKSLGLDGHQAVLAAHHDRDHRHVHAAVNRVSTEDGRAVNLRQSGRRLSAWAEQYERTHGGIQVPTRVERRQAVVERKQRPPMQRRVGPGRVHRPPAERRQWNRQYQRQRDNPREPALERRDRVRLSRRHRRLRPARTAVAVGRVAARAALVRTRSAGSVVARGAQSAIIQFGRDAAAGTRSAVSAIARSAIVRSAIDALAAPLRDHRARKQWALDIERHRERAREEATAARLPEKPRQLEKATSTDGRPAPPRHSELAKALGQPGLLPRPAPPPVTGGRSVPPRHIVEALDQALTGVPPTVQPKPQFTPVRPKLQAPTATEPTKTKERPVGHQAPVPRQPAPPQPIPAARRSRRPKKRSGQRRPVEPARPATSAAPAPSESRVEQLFRERKRIDQLFKDARGARRQFEMEREARTAERDLQQEIRKLPWAERRQLEQREREHGHDRGGGRGR